MSATNINRIVMTGNLTRDPALRTLPSGMSVCSMRIACNTRRKVNDVWADKPNYFDITVWGAQGENCARYLAKGRPVAIDGRLEWREYERDGEKRQAVDIIADSVQFLGGKPDDAPQTPPATTDGDVPVGELGSPGDAPAEAEALAGVGAADDDIPF